MWEPYRLSMEQWVPQCRIVYDKFHVMQHANQAVDEVRRAEFFRKGGRLRELVKGKRWLLLSRWVHYGLKKSGGIIDWAKGGRVMVRVITLLGILSLPAWSETGPVSEASAPAIIGTFMPALYNGYLYSVVPCRATIRIGS